jgi:hypothetical protein
LLVLLSLICEHKAEEIIGKPSTTTIPAGQERKGRQKHGYSRMDAWMDDERGSSTLIMAVYACPSVHPFTLTMSF